MAVGDEILRLHERIDTLDDVMSARHEEVAAQLSEIHTTLTTVATACTICRRMVLGNGRDSIDRRVTRLETVGAIGGKGFWLVVGVGASLLSAAVAAVVAAAMRS